MDSTSAAPPRHAPGDEMDHAATPSASFRNAGAGVHVQQTPVRPAADLKCLATAGHSSSIQTSQLLDQGERELLGFEGKVATEVADQLDTNCFREIQNLLWIENFPLHRKALEEWERKAKFHASSIERKKRREGNVANEIYNLIGFYSAFQGVLLTAVSQSVLISGCGKEPVRFELRLCFVLLSCSVSLLTILGAIAKLGRVREIATSIWIEEQDFGDVNVKVQELRRCGGHFKFRDRQYDKPSQLGTSWPKFVIVVPALIVFACLFSLSIWLITKE